MMRDEWEDSSDPRRAAAAWLAQLDGEELPAAKREAFAEWLCKSPANISEYLQLLALNDKLRSAEITQGLQSGSVLTDAATNVTVLPGSAIGSQASSNRKLNSADNRASAAVAFGTKTSRWYSKHRAIKFAAGLAMCAIAAGGWYQFSGKTSFAGTTYETGVGELRSLSLKDGSIVELNTRSRIRVNYSAQARDIVLLSGEALFSVAKDAKRPFRVQSNLATVRALGTQFNVRRDAAATTVAVLEGKVEVISTKPNGASAQNDTKPVPLSAGYGVTIQSSKPLNISAVRLERPQSVVAWKTRLLEFDAASLETVVNEFNRYNFRQIHIEDPVLRSKQVTGVFDATRPETLAEFLKKHVDSAVVMQEADGDWVVR